MKKNKKVGQISLPVETVSEKLKYIHEVLLDYRINVAEGLVVDRKDAISKLKEIDRASTYLLKQL
tara:strand:- start:431 stop:625 length:195 start_codon:yes stop_codon:yes gene_type:complete